MIKENVLMTEKQWYEKHHKTATLYGVKWDIILEMMQTLNKMNIDVNTKEGINKFKEQINQTAINCMNNGIIIKDTKAECIITCDSELIQSYFKCDIDGDCLCVMGKNFINLVESDAVFIQLTEKQMQELNKMEMCKE